MKNFFYILLLTFSFQLLTLNCFSQWPGYFYSFELKDSDGNAINSKNENYVMTPIPFDKSSDIMLSIKICEDNKTWRWYEGGYHDLDKTHRLKIEKYNDEFSEIMYIEFPSSLSGGKEKYYRNLYVGSLTFKKGTYTIKLPKTDDEWDALKEIQKCPLSYMNYSYHDISKFQKQ